MKPVFPSEFADFLTARGQRILAGRTDPLVGALAQPRCRFLNVLGLIDKRQAEVCRQGLERHLLPAMRVMADIIPPETIDAMTENYGEWLPKTMRVKTAYLEQRRSRAYEIAQELGLVGMLKSESLRTMASVVAGRPLRKKSGMQALCYGPGDYAGPHNDHHPQEAEAADGYIDMHVSLASPTVAHQYLVYASEGHFQNMTQVNTLGGITFYRLPFWHYATPLIAKRGHEATARRWVLLGTFLFKSSPRQFLPAAAASATQVR